MFFDRAMGIALRNFATLFLVAACLTVPLHVGKAFLFRHVEAVWDLHDEIEEFPSERKVRAVGPAELGTARRAAMAIGVLELLMVPVLIGAARRVVARAAHDTPPGVLDAWAHARPGGLRALRREPGAVLGGLLVAGAVAWLVGATGRILIEPLDPTVAFAGLGLVEGVARAAAAPFLLSPPAVAGSEADDDEAVLQNPRPGER